MYYVYLVLFPQKSGQMLWFNQCNIFETVYIFKGFNLLLQFGLWVLFFCFYSIRIAIIFFMVIHCE